MCRNVSEIETWIAEFKQTKEYTIIYRNVINMLYIKGTISNLSLIIIPPIEEQNYIVNHLQKIKEKIISLKQQAEKNRISAQKEFEKELFE